MAAPVRIYFGLAFALTWGVGGVGLLAGILLPGSHPLSPSSPLYYLAAYGQQPAQNQRPVLIVMMGGLSAAPRRDFPGA